MMVRLICTPWCLKTFQNKGGLPSPDKAIDCLVCKKVGIARTKILKLFKAFISLLFPVGSLHLPCPLLREGTLPLSGLFWIPNLLWFHQQLEIGGG